LFEKFKNQISRLFKGSKGSHDWEHTERVLNLAVHIGKKEKADLNIIKYAAILHDIARAAEDRSRGKLCHAALGARMAFKILKKTGMNYKKIKHITHCIETHRYRGNKKPKTLEAKVLFDADKLDSIGAVGIGRAFLFAGEVGAKLHNKGVNISKTKAYSKEDTAYREYLVKLKHIKKKVMTAEGKRLATERHRFMVEFFERINKEVDGIL
jgi:uncharacterized protein